MDCCASGSMFVSGPRPSGSRTTPSGPSRSAASSPRCSAASGGLEAKPCVQTFTFGQHNHHDLGNNHRPLSRLRWSDAPLLPRRHPRAVMAARERRQAGRSARAGAGRCIRLHPCHRQQQAAPALASDPIERGTGRTLHQAHNAPGERSWIHSPAQARLFASAAGWATLAPLSRSTRTTAGRSSRSTA